MTHISPALPPFDGLQAVVAAGKAGSFTAAAAELGLTHGSVSRRIQHVEQWLGTQLFERHGRGVRLTPAGTRLVRHVQEAFGHIAQVAEPWRSPRGPQAVRISVLPSFAKLWLLPRMAALRGHPADLHIELLIQYELADFAADRIDFAIRHGKGPWPHLRSKPLLDETLVAAASPALARKLGRNASPEAIVAQPLIHNSDSSDWRQWLRTTGVRVVARPNDYRFEDYDITLSAAEAGLGVVLVRRPFAEAVLAAGTLVPVSPRQVNTGKGHHVVSPLEALSPAAALCIERLHSAAEPRRPRRRTQ